MFTVRELARSQGFPDWFTFVVEKEVAQDRIVKTVSGFLCFESSHSLSLRPLCYIGADYHNYA